MDVLMYVYLYVHLCKYLFVKFFGFTSSLSSGDGVDVDSNFRIVTLKRFNTAVPN